MSNELTARLDVAQVVLYAFWIFFFGLIFWLRREDRREGYPLETDNPRRITPRGAGILSPPPKTFLLPHGGSVESPNFERDAREIHATRSAPTNGSPFDPEGDPMLSGVGPASFAQRVDKPELTSEGHDLIVPMRVATDFNVSAGFDPRGWDVVGTDGNVAGTVKDLWVDRADVMIRYFEVALAGEGSETRMLPMPMLRVDGETKKIRVASIKAEHFANVPTLKEADRITLLEEDRIGAFYASGRLYAEPKRLGPVV